MTYCIVGSDVLQIIIDWRKWRATVKYNNILLPYVFSSSRRTPSDLKNIKIVTGVQI